MIASQVLHFFHGKTLYFLIKPNSLSPGKLPCSHQHLLQWLPILCPLIKHLLEWSNTIKGNNYNTSIVELCLVHHLAEGCISSMMTRLIIPHVCSTGWFVWKTVDLSFPSRLSLHSPSGCHYVPGPLRQYYSQYSLPKIHNRFAGSPCLKHSCVFNIQCPPPHLPDPAPPSRNHYSHLSLFFPNHS